jgi:autophagy-related protein 9
MFVSSNAVESKPFLVYPAQYAAVLMHTSLPTSWSILLWVVAVGWIYLLFTFIMDVPRLYELHDFYHHLLDIPDSEIQTASWQYVVGRLMSLRDSNIATAEDLSAANRRFLKGQSKQRMDAHDIANRLMRKDNYWIAMINRDILDTSVEIPLLGTHRFFSRTLEWNISLVINEYVFDEDGHILEAFTKSKNRKELIDVLKRRFYLVGLMSIFMSFILVPYFIVHRFFDMFMVWQNSLPKQRNILIGIQEYQKNPAELSTRDYTPHAQWKMREYNELIHLFEKRKLQSYQYADEYLKQFPKDKTGQVAKFVVFISGALGAVLGLISLLDTELFLGFEINGRPVIFWLGALGMIWGVARGLVPQTRAVEDPEDWLMAANIHTRYVPSSWNGRLNTYEVQQEFASLYKLEIVMFLEEVAGIILTPWIFITRLPKCSEQIIDFFREFTVHIDGLGHVCSFAVFDFKNGGQAGPRSNLPAGDPRSDFYKDRDDKLSQSVMFFQDTYAGVPRRGLHHPKRPFHLPPSFPGIGSIHGTTALQHSIMAAQRYAGPANLHPEGPMHSVLLDPHHQPRNSPRVAPQMRQRGNASKHDGSPRLAPHRTSSAIIEEDSELGDSWAVRADAGVDGDGQGDGAAEIGVVGNILKSLRYQSTRGGGINL